MATQVSGIELLNKQEEFSSEGNVEINARFSILGDLRDSFNEKNWTEAYGKFDNTFKLKYGIRVQSGGSLRKHSLKDIDTYRKASIFWTRNPKLVNPMKEKRVWVQVAKNFEPIIRLTEEEVRQELFDFDEKIVFKASELGSGMHKIKAEVSARWQKHDYVDAGNVKGASKEIEISIN